MEELIKKTTIEFPRPVGLREFEKMLSYISESVPTDIDYRVSYYRNLRNHGSNRSSDREEGSVEVGGMIRLTRIPLALENFTTSTSKKDYRKIASMRFNLVPGIDEQDYMPQVRELWGDVRQAVQKYFEKNKRKK